MVLTFHESSLVSASTKFNGNLRAIFQKSPTTIIILYPFEWILVYLIFYFQYDIGGPLLLYDSEGKNATIHGVASFNHPSGCDQGYPSGYVRVEPFRTWINAVTGL